ncbi:MAG: PP2C family protein-serine/threonine phosphatase, partial [Clostridia bacterium]|nr:PP2C family protein-serine/threonine phosphatase [Clostridia bacterium]
TYFGEWDPYLLRSLPYEGERQITGEMISMSIQYYALPRCMILVGLNFACSTLATRTRKLLELQVKESAEKHRIESELNVATQIQTSMLPTNFPEREEINLFASMSPAREVGGDFYDFFMVDDRHLAIVMADVSGKGVPAALFMVIGKTLVKDHTQPDSDLGDVFSRVNNLLCESNSEGLFITAFEGVLDLVTGEFNFVNAGHEMPMISRGGNPFEAHKIRPGFVLAGMEDVRFNGGSLILEPGDKLFQYTDGVTEATNSNDELYGMQRLTDVLAVNCQRTAQEIIPAVRADIDAFVGDAPQFDDITMLCLEYKARMAVADQK